MHFENHIYWNIVKGIGIVLVVLGHICPNISGYIYLFHLPLFFFVSGYLYNEEKYGDKPFVYLKKRIKSQWIRYVLIYWGLILLHNLFCELRMIGKDAEKYSITVIIQKMIEAVFGMGQEIMGGTLWFVPVLVIASVLLGFIVSLSRKLEQLTNWKYFKYFVQMVFIIIGTCVGYRLCYETVYLVANVQISLIVMPFLWIGYLVSSFEVDFKKFLNPFVVIIFAIILYFTSCKYRLDLALEFVYPFMHVVALMGIYICLYLAKIIQDNSKISELFAFLGKMSFWVMFLHFPMLRVIDWIYTIGWNECDFVMYEKMPIAYPQLWPIYIVTTLVVPLGIYVYRARKINM